MEKVNRQNCLLIICLLLFSSFSLAQDKKFPPGIRVHKPLVNPAESVMDINNITSWVGEDGYHDWLVGGAWNGVYPGGTFIGSIFSEGIVWGGKVNDGISPMVRVNGNTWGSGCSPITRLYRVRPDYMTADLTNDASNFFNIPVSEVTSSQIQELRDQYQADWNEWPADDGAPFNDVDHNGQYNPAVDIPGISGAEQTLFIKYNDDLSPSLYGSPQIGLEVSETYWGYFVSGPLGNVIFKKVDIKYVGTSLTPPSSYIDSMYVCQWADPDVGNNIDDFAGCDTTLNLGFAYNSSAYDEVYSLQGLNPPAAGYAFLQCVSEYTGNANDSAIINFKWQHGFRFIKNKPMDSFIYFGGAWWYHPGNTYTGTLEFYNTMRGYMPDPPYPATGLFPSDVADYSLDGVYLLTGDPVAGTGKIDGIIDAAGDRIILSVNGPFHLNTGETAEVVIALAAGMGDSHLNSITKLRANVVAADTSFMGLVESGQVQVVNIEPGLLENTSPEDFVLYQNYPNPYNPSTKIKFSVPSAIPTGGKNLVILKVYDVLGNEVATLVNEEKPAGLYEVTFDASRLSSGVYFYQLEAGSFIQSKKMVLMK